MRLEGDLAATQLSDVKRLPQFSVSLGQKEVLQQGLCSIPLKRAQWELQGDFEGKKKKLFLKKMSIQNNFNKCQKIKSISLHPNL